MTSKYYLVSKGEEQGNAALDPVIWVHVGRYLACALRQHERPPKYTTPGNANKVACNSVTKGEMKGEKGVVTSNVTTKLVEWPVVDRTPLRVRIL